MALTIPLRVRGIDGQATVRYGANDDPAYWGFDLLRLPFDIARIRDFPICQAGITYRGEGYRAFMDRIRLITVTPHEATPAAP